MRMFDTSAPPTDGPLNPELCPHVWPREGEPVTLVRPGFGPAQATEHAAVSYRCTFCGAQLVLADRAS